MIDGTVDGLEIRLTSWHVKYTIIYRVLLPSKRWVFGISSINSSKHIELEFYDAHFWWRFWGPLEKLYDSDFPQKRTVVK